MSKNISYAKMDDVLKQYVEQNTTVNLLLNSDDSACLEVEVRGALTLQEKIDFLNELNNYMFVPDEDGRVDYRTAMEKVVVRFCIYKYCTNLKMDSLMRVAAFCNNDQIFYMFLENSSLIGEMLSMAYNEINFRKNDFIACAANRANETLSEARKQNESIAAIVEQFKSIDMGEFMKVMGNVSEMSEEDRINKILDFQRREQLND